MKTTTKIQSKPSNAYHSNGRDLCCCGGTQDSCKNRNKITYVEDIDGELDDSEDEKSINQRNQIKETPLKQSVVFLPR